MLERKLVPFTIKPTILLAQDNTEEPEQQQHPPSFDNNCHAPLPFFFVVTGQPFNLEFGYSTNKLPERFIFLIYNF